MGRPLESGDITFAAQRLDLTEAHIHAVVEVEAAQLTQINETMRVELASGDKLESYWRPLTGYVITLTLGATMLAVSNQIIWGTDAATTISSGGELGWLWGIGLSVLGVNVTKRSHDRPPICVVLHKGL